MNILLAFKSPNRMPECWRKKEWQAVAARGQKRTGYFATASLLGADERAAAALLAQKNGTPMSLTALSMGG